MHQNVDLLQHNPVLETNQSTRYVKTEFHSSLGI
jgi:hypothetical protein